MKPDFPVRSSVSVRGPNVHGSSSKEVVFYPSFKDTHHLMVEAIREHVVPAASLPRLLHAWQYPVHEEFRVCTAWSPYNLFTDFMKSRSPQRQIDGTLRLTNVFRRELAL